MSIPNNPIVDSKIKFHGKSLEAEEEEDFQLESEEEWNPDEIEAGAKKMAHDDMMMR